MVSKVTHRMEVDGKRKLLSRFFSIAFKEERQIDSIIFIWRFELHFARSYTYLYTHMYTHTYTHAHTDWYTRIHTQAHTQTYYT